MHLKKCVRDGVTAVALAALAAIGTARAQSPTVTYGYVNSTATISITNNDQTGASVSYSITDNNDNGANSGQPGYAVKRINGTVSGTTGFSDQYETVDELGSEITYPTYTYSVNDPVAGNGFVAWQTTQTYWWSNVRPNNLNQSMAALQLYKYQIYVAQYDRQYDRWDVSIVAQYEGSNGVYGEPSPAIPYFYNLGMGPQTLNGNSGYEVYGQIDGYTAGGAYIDQFPYFVNAPPAIPIAWTPPAAPPPPTPATPPSSSSSAATVGTPWTPPFSGGVGDAGNEFYVNGYTGWISGSWTPPASAAGANLTFYVACVPASGYSGNNSNPTLEVNSQPYTVTINAAQAVAPTSENESNAVVGTPWSPPYFGGTPGTDTFCIAGVTNFGAQSWTPTATGTYDFYVGEVPAAGYIGNVTDPNLGNFEVNTTGYSITVGPGQATPPTSVSTTASVGVPWSPAITAGAGNAQLYFCVSGVTNFGTGAWTPAAAGTYYFYVGATPKSGYDGNVTDANLGVFEVNTTAYTVTVH
ncbi:MAG TPA: hypothetical protein VGL42_08835 [Opitutaceae bacterium]|jgi:hypothetical protein